jgi:PAS domain S-box-containing protein
MLYVIQEHLMEAANGFAGSEPTPQGERILLVDDSAENLISLEAALEGLGQEVVTARSGKEALRHLLDSDFAAILLDVKMPEMDGFQTAELIRARKRSRHTPILFLTAYKSDEHLFRGYDMGAVDFLFKPIVPEILRSKVSVFVELSRHAALLQHQTAVLTKAEQKFRSLLEAAPDAIVISSEAGRINLVNSQAEILTGYRREELIDRDIRSIIPDWCVDLLSHSSSIAAHPLGLPNERLMCPKGSAEFPVEINLKPLQTDEGLLVISAIRDITERKRVEHEIRELNTRLEQRVAERTSELQESNEALRQSNDDLNQFAYAAGHDLQEPLRMVALYSQLLRENYEGKIDEEADQYISFIANGATRMERLLKDLLAYCQAGSVANPAAPVDCEAVMKQVLLNLHVSIEENRAMVRWRNLPTVQADQVRLVQLFQNLIGNSIKYRSEDTPCIEIITERRDEEWLFAVRDNGLGIPPEYSEQVFGVFKRLHGNAYPGTGIGLAICQRIVETYGGRIWVESAPGKGSKFCFTLLAAANRSPYVSSAANVSP